MVTHMKRLFLSLAGGVLFPASFLVMTLMITDILGLRELKPVAKLLFLAVAWPLKFFSYMFPADDSDFSPTSEALIASALVDLFLYSMLSYVFLWLRARRKRLS